MEEQFEFTDRYGGRMPSWLRGCHGQCEAMGWVPVFGEPSNIKEGKVHPIQEIEPGKEAEEVLYQQAWFIAHKAPDAHKEEPCDGYHFVKCVTCGGSGRVSWLASLARIPRWVVKGIRFYPSAMDKERSPEHLQPFWPRLKLWIWCSFGADVARLRN